MARVGSEVVHHKGLSEPNMNYIEYLYDMYLYFQSTKNEIKMPSVDSCDSLKMISTTSIAA